jgi:hypothetical protein
MCVIVLFRMRACLRVAIDWSWSSEPVTLVQDAGHSYVTCIGLENNHRCQIEVLQD